MKKMSMKYAKLGVKSLLYEVAASPKPGLVDRFDSGAHDDMDIFTFISSSVVLYDYFEKCFENGYELKGEFTGKLSAIREIGKKAEIEMFKATDNINTHKGLVFSFGIIFQALGICISRNLHRENLVENLCVIVRSTSAGISQELLKYRDDKLITYGEEIFKKYNLLGVRGEVESGFSNVVEYGLPVLKNSILSMSMNDSIVQCLMNIMQYVDDTNILGRHDMKTLEYVKRKATFINQIGAMKTQEGIESIIECNKEFIEKNISSGGSADLTAISILFYLLELYVDD